jgi:hypothetical protein
LTNNVFTLTANNKAKDGDQLRKTKDAMSLYIGRIYGEECGKEFELGMLNVRPLPIVSANVRLRHAAKIAANTTRLQAKIASLTTMQTAIGVALAANPSQFDLVDKGIDTEDKQKRAAKNCSI